MSDPGLRFLSPNTYELPQKKGMNVPGRIYANERILRGLDENVMNQIENVASLPGILSYSIAMPDAHQGYGFPIGGVAAFPYPGGIISPGGIGYDINCGIRMMKTGVPLKDLSKHISCITDLIFQNIPLGLGQGAIYRPGNKELVRILDKGAEFIVEIGMGEETDLERCESRGHLAESDPGEVSQRAVERGSFQLGSLGSGNHFIEIDAVEEIFDEKFAGAAGLFKDEIVILIHSGSRGLGHQITTDWIRILEKEISKKNIFLKDRQLVYTRSDEENGKKYFAAMNAGANFAFANRQLMTHRIRTVLKKNISNSLNCELVCDCCHNIAMIENWRGRKIMVHRKGATRADSRKMAAFGGALFSSPVIIPGSMGSGFILASPEDKCEETFLSLPHGSGRLLSRKQATKKFRESDIKKQLMKKGIYVKNNSREGVSEEAPEAYKGLEDIVETVTKAGLAREILRGRPLGNIKG